MIIKKFSKLVRIGTRGRGIFLPAVWWQNLQLEKGTILTVEIFNDDTIKITPPKTGEENSKDKILRSEAAENDLSNQT